MPVLSRPERGQTSGDTWGRLAQTLLGLGLATLLAGAAPAQTTAPVANQAADQATNLAPPVDCTTLTDQAMALDFKAATVQPQRSNTAVQARALDEAIAVWSQAVELCRGRPRERAQRSLADNLKQRDALAEVQGVGERCQSSQRDGAALQELADKALAERRWGDAAALLHKAETLWDVAAERCTGTAQQLAVQRRDRLETDGHNAEHCAPRVERAQELTQRQRGASSGMSPAERSAQSQAAETLWREAANHCKGAALDQARANAQSLARERGTPWVLAGPAPRGTPTATAAPSDIDLALADGGRIVGRFSLDPGGRTYTGKGRIAWANGDRYEGELLRGRRHGQGEFTWPSGQHYRGEWLDDRPEGSGSMRFANGNQYEGVVVGGVPQGEGRMVYASGDVYRGRMGQGVPDGRGEYLWAAGQRYEGPWVAGQARGSGTMSFANGNHYVGEVLDGKPMGSGRMRFASGDIYEGGFAAGVQHGQGVYLWPSGQRYEGPWVQGRATGQGSMRFANGNLYTGAVLDGQPHGEGELVYAVGERYEGSFAQGVPHGRGRYTWKNGDVYVGEWRAGRKDGQGRFQWANGDRWEGLFRDDEQTERGTLVRKRP